MSQTTDGVGGSAPLTRDSIASAAIDIVDAEGLDALTMRHLGRRLGVEAMSIYHHVPNKSALLDLLVADLLAAAADLDPTTDDPIALFETHARDLRDAIRSHPHLAPMVAERLPPTITSSRASRALIDVLTAAGFDREAATWIVAVFQRFAIGQSVVEVTTDDSGDDAIFETGLRLLVVGLRDELGL